MNQSLIIIHDGKLAIKTEFDGQDMVIDYVGKGAIINPHNFLMGRKSAITTQCLTSVVYYYLPYHKLLSISEAYPALRRSVRFAAENAKFNVELE